MKFLKNATKPKARKYIYRVFIAVIVLLGSYGYITDAVIPFYGALVLSILGLATADGNVVVDEEETEVTSVTINESSTPSGTLIPAETYVIMPATETVAIVEHKPKEEE